MENILALLFLFGITAFTNTLATLKTIFVSKKILKPAFVVVFIDALIFATVMRAIANNDAFSYAVAFAFGKVVGVYVGSLIENKLGIGTLEIQLFVTDKDKMKGVADELRDIGYTVNTMVTHGMEGTKRYLIESIVARREFQNYIRILKKHGIEDPTLKIKSVDKTDGKISVKTTES